MEAMINEKKLIPFSDYNYNNDGQPDHDCLVGTIYTRLLMLDMPFSYTRYYYEKGMKRKEDVYPDARIEILHSSANKRILYGEGDTGTEDVDVIVEKIGKYYRQYIREDKKKYVLFVFQDQYSDKGLSLVKGIIKRYDRIRDVYYMRDALNSMLSGVETLFVPHCICEAYIPFIMKKESEHIFLKKIKELLEKQYGQVLSYAKEGAPFLTIRNISDLYLRNCYYYYGEDNQPIEIYVENISASLSAMVRVATLACELLGVSLQNRNCTVICMVDSRRDMQLFNKLLIRMNKKYNAATQLRIPVYYLLYDNIKTGELLHCN